MIGKIMLHMERIQAMLGLGCWQVRLCDCAKCSSSWNILQIIPSFMFENSRLFTAIKLTQNCYLYYNIKIISSQLLIQSYISSSTLTAHVILKDYPHHFTILIILDERYMGCLIRIQNNY